MLIGDPSSYLNENPTFTPHPALAPKGEFGLAQLIRGALAAH
jgi:hypothetical protein